MGEPMLCALLLREMVEASRPLPGEGLWAPMVCRLINVGLAGGVGGGWPPVERDAMSQTPLTRGIPHYDFSRGMRRPMQSAQHRMVIVCSLMQLKVVCPFEGGPWLRAMKADDHDRD